MQGCWPHPAIGRLAIGPLCFGHWIRCKPGLMFPVPSCIQVKEIVEKGASSRVAAAEADEQLQVPGPVVAAGRCHPATMCGWILQLLSLP